MSKHIERLLWSIALPGFGQLLNGRIIKGIIFIFLEFIVNVKAHFNEAIMASFQGNIELAIEVTHFGWLMFYPCLYFFAMWDAFKDAGGGKRDYAYMPFAFCAYFVTVGLMYSTKLQLFGVLLGPIWLPMLSVIPGVAVGFILMKILQKRKTTVT